MSKDGQENETHSCISNNGDDMLANFLKNLVHNSSPIETEAIADLGVYNAPNLSQCSVRLFRELTKNYGLIKR